MTELFSVSIDLLISYLFLWIVFQFVIIITAAVISELKMYLFYVIPHLL